MIVLGVPMKMIYIRRLLLHLCMIGATLVQLFLLSSSSSSSSSNSASLIGHDDGLAVRPPPVDGYARVRQSMVVVSSNVPPHQTTQETATTATGLPRRDRTTLLGPPVHGTTTDHPLIGQQEGINKAEVPTTATGTTTTTTLANPSTTSMMEPPNEEPVFMTHFVNAPRCRTNGMLETNHTHTNVTLTLVTQTSMDRLWMMEQHCQRWGTNHPISIAIATNVSTRILSTVLQQMGCSREQMTIQTYGDFHSPESYPVNKLRNMALSAVQTSHALLLDMDFLLEKNAHDILERFQSTLAVDDRVSLVVPAFELRSLCSTTQCQKIHEALLPHTKADLLDLYWNLETSSPDAIVAPFDSKKNTVGHGSTRYRDWPTQRENELLPIECVTSPRYEPYLVVRYCHDLPPFQEAFHGYGQNKMTWTQHLIRLGYRFYQTPTFCIHFPHKPSDARKQWDRQRHAILMQSRRSTSNITNATTNESVDVADAAAIVVENDPSVLYASLKVNQISAKFQTWMREHVPDRSVVSQCS